MNVTTVSAIEYRSVIRFLMMRGFTGNDILNELNLAYGSNAPSRSTVYYWIGEFKRGRQSVFPGSFSGTENSLDESDKLKRVIH